MSIRFLFSIFLSVFLCQNLVFTMNEVVQLADNQEDSHQQNNSQNEQVDNQSEQNSIFIENLLEENGINIENNNENIVENNQNNNDNDRADVQVNAEQGNLQNQVTNDLQIVNHQVDLQQDNIQTQQEPNTQEISLVNNNIEIQQDNNKEEELIEINNIVGEPDKTDEIRNIMMFFINKIKEDGSKITEEDIKKFEEMRNKVEKGMKNLSQKISKLTDNEKRNLEKTGDTLKNIFSKIKTDKNLSKKQIDFISKLFVEDKCLSMEAFMSNFLFVKNHPYITLFFVLSFFFVLKELIVVDYMLGHVGLNGVLMQGSIRRFLHIMCNYFVGSVSDNILFSFLYVSITRIIVDLTCNKLTKLKKKLKGNISMGYDFIKENVLIRCNLIKESRVVQAPSNFVKKGFFLGKDCMNFVKRSFNSSKDKLCDLGNGINNSHKKLLNSSKEKICNLKKSYLNFFNKKKNNNNGNVILEVPVSL